jgi:hypothetical protein
MCFGRGTTQIGPEKYTKPKTKTKLIKHIGHRYFMIWDKKDQQLHVYLDSDFWKSFLHQRLGCARDEAGAMVIHRAKSANAHLPFTKQLLAEIRQEEFIPGRGTVSKFVKKHGNNHYGDAGYLACAAAHFKNVRIIQPEDHDRPT